MSKYYLTIAIFLSALFGFSAGIIGSIVYKTYLAELILPEFREINLSNDASNAGFVIRDAKKVIVEQDDKIDESIGNAANIIVGIYKKSDTDNLGKHPLALKNNLSQGVIITSDGWIISHFEIAAKTKLTDYTVVTKDKKIYNIDKSISDKELGLVFLHIKAVNLPVLSMTELNDNKRGQLAFSLNWTGTNHIGNISGISENNPNAYKSSEDNNKKIDFLPPLSKVFQGSAVFNLSGAVCGFVNAKSEIIPATYVKNDLKSVIKLGVIKKPSLGVNYLDLSQTIGSDLENGALVYANGSSTVAVLPKSAAAAKIKMGDLIKSINNEDINAEKSLSVLIDKFLPGDKIKATIIREKKELEIEVVLGEKKQ